jgi:hypothetical protein
MSTTKAGAKWGDARVAFRVIAAEVMVELQRGRTVRSVYEDMKPRFPAGYAQFAKYVQRSAAHTDVRASAFTATRALRAQIPGQGPKKDGPLEITLGPPPRRFSHTSNMTPEELEEYLIGPPAKPKQDATAPSGERGRR